MTDRTILEMRVDAQQRIILQLVGLLHARGILLAQELVSALESSDYSAVAAYDLEPNPFLQAMIQSLGKIAQVRPGPPQSD